MDIMQRALDDVLINNMPVKTAASKHNIDRSNLRRKLTAIRRGETLQTAAYGKTSMKVFTEPEELQLKDYCIRASKMGYGLSTAKLRSLAYEFATKLKKRLPYSRKGRKKTWTENHEAGKDWQRAFLKRNGDLSIRKPEATSIGRMSAFNSIYL